MCILPLLLLVLPFANSAPINPYHENPNLHYFIIVALPICFFILTVFGLTLFCDIIIRAWRRYRLRRQRRRQLPTYEEIEMFGYETTDNATALFCPTCGLTRDVHTSGEPCEPRNPPPTPEPTLETTEEQLTPVLIRHD